MQKLHKLFNPLRTPQHRSIDEQQIKNSAGGYVWELSPWQRLDRFLVLGTEGGTYYIDEQTLTVENAQNVIALLKEEGVRLAELDPADPHAVVQRVLLTYERTVNGALTELETAILRQDVSKIVQISHTLRSSSASVGALDFSVLCGDLEKSIRDGRTANLEARAGELARAGRAVVVAVRQLLVARGYDT